MQVVAVCSSPAMGSCLLNALEAQGIQTSIHLGVGRLAPADSFRQTDAVVVEDDGRNLESWLTLLAGRLPGTTPIVVYGPGDPRAMAMALHRGAHDYATTIEGAAVVGWRLMARQLAVEMKQARAYLHIGSYVLDRAQQTLRLGGAAEQLTGREAALLAALAARPGWVIATESLSLDLCRRSAELGHRSVEQHVYRLRKKVDDLHRAAGFDAGLRLTTVYGVGYRLDLPEGKELAVCKVA